MHITWSDALNTHSNVMIQGFRESYKSSMMLVGYATRDIYFRTNRRGLVYGHTKPQACAKLDRIVEACLNNELLAPLIPQGQRDRESKAELRKLGSYTINAVGIGSPARGEHPHWVVVDDPFEDKMRFSHQFIKDYFFRTVMNMRLEEPDCHTILIGTPQTKGDLLHDARIMDNNDWKFLRYPAIIDHKKKLVSWPEIWNFNRLLKRKAIIGDLEFEQEFQLNPMDSSAGQMFPSGLIQGKSLDYSLHYYSTFSDKNCFMAVDPSFGSKDNCVFIVGYVEKGILFIIHIDARADIKGDPVKFLKRLQDKQYRFKVKMTYMEKNSLHSILAEIKKIEQPIRLIDSTRDLKVDMFKETLVNRFERDTIKFPYMTKSDQTETNNILLELNNLGFDKKGKLRALHGKDDRAIALAILSHFSIKGFNYTGFFSGSVKESPEQVRKRVLYSSAPEY